MNDLWKLEKEYLDWFTKNMMDYLSSRLDSTISLYSTNKDVKSMSKHIKRHKS